MRSRRGVAAIELALGIGVLVLMASAVIDYGLFMRDLAYANLAVREAARVGTETDLSASPEDAAESRLEASLADAGLAARPHTTDARLSGSSPDIGLTVVVDLDAAPVVGLVPLPAAAEASITMRMQDQSR